MRIESKYIIRQNLWCLAAIVIFVVLITSGLFYLIDSRGKNLNELKIVLAVIAVLSLIFILLQRVLSWEMTLLNEQIFLSKPFLRKRTRVITIPFTAIRELAIVQGFRISTSLYISTTSGKKYSVFLDLNTKEIAEFVKLSKSLRLPVRLYCQDGFKRKLGMSENETA